MSTDIWSLDLNLLRSLDVLIDERHVTRAASRVGLSQPGMSNALSRLREFFDDPILVRVGGTMEPTPKALALAGPVRRALDEIERALLLTTEFAPEKSDRVFRLAVSFFGFLFVPGLLARVRSLAPGVRFEIEYVSGPDAPDGNLIDIYIGSRQRDDLHSALIYSDDLVILACADHPRIDSAVDLDLYLDLDHIILMTDDPGVEGLERKAAELGRRDGGVEMSHPIGLQQIVRENHLVATVSRRCASTLLDDSELRIVELPEELSGEVELKVFWNGKHSEDDGHKWLRDQVLACA